MNVEHIPARPPLRVSLRLKLALVSLLLLALPWVGYQYVREVERFLLDGQREGLANTARAVATALHERPQLFGIAPRRSEVPPDQSISEDEELLAPPTPVPLRTNRSGAGEVAAILKGLERTTSRIWVANRDLEVLAQTGSLKPADKAGGKDPSAPSVAWRRLLGWLWQPPPEDFNDALEDNALAGGQEIAGVLLGSPVSWLRKSRDGRATIVAAAHPVWANDQVLGMVVVEETTNPILTLRNQALERLMLLTLTGFAVAALVLMGFATRLSWRIRRLRDEAERAIDPQGRITHFSASRAGDEVGDLSRSFAALLARLDQHHNYLETMASRLSHELRTPIAVVRSSLENLHLEPLPESAQTYIQRADEGLTRLTRIFARMSEASRMEQSLASTEPERFDLGALVTECAQGYRLAHPKRIFEDKVPRYPVWVLGTPDLAAQMLDKLVENAGDFATPGTPIRIELDFEGVTSANLAVINQGPPLPTELDGRLFESMVSGRKGSGTHQPHLGLGLYVARMIARFHGGELHAANLPGGGGVRFWAELRLA